LETGSENLPLLDFQKVQPEELPRWCGFDVAAVRQSIKSMTGTYAKESQPDVMCVRKRNRLIGEKIFGAMRTSFKAMTIGVGSSTEFQPVLIGVTTKMTGGMRITGGAVFTLTPGGEKIVAHFFNTWLRYQGGIKRIWNWIEKKWIRVTNRVICNSLAINKIKGTVEKFKPCKNTFLNWKPVYDLVNAGPRHRFTVLSDEGPLIVHNCGYQGGVGAFQTMARGYGVKVSDARAEEIKTEWRNIHPRIKQYWYDIEYAAKDAVMNPGTKTVARHMSYIVKGSFLFCRLPSGRVLTYPYPKLKERETPWGELREQIHYMKVDGLTNKWEETHTYGGSLVENITQAVARDVMADAMTKLSGKGWEVCFSVHDEIVSETVDGSLTDYLRIMAEVPSWAPGLPIAVEGWAGKRYRKG
jgi:DNA polymerase